MTNRIHKCPECGHEQKYKHYNNWWRAEKENRLCIKCIYKKRDNRIDGEYIRNCPECNVTIKYKYSSGVSFAKKNNSLCIKCANNNIEHKRKLSKSLSGKIPYIKGKKFSLESKKKCRISAIKRIERNVGHQISPNFNPDACKLIDEYGKKYGYNFQHAMNGGEYFIQDLGYWVDGYDSRKNIVIEIDEKKHFDANGNLRKKDIVRQNEIKHQLNCKFIRIKLEKYNAK